MKSKMTFDEKFAVDDTTNGHSSFTLTADGCMNRLVDTSVGRRGELNDRIESFGGAAEADERMIQNYLFTLSKHGKHPRKEESIEAFILRHIEIISSYK